MFEHFEEDHDELFVILEIVYEQFHIGTLDDSGDELFYIRFNRFSWEGFPVSCGINLHSE